MKFACRRAGAIGLIAAALIGNAVAQEALTLHGLKFPGSIQGARRGTAHDFEKTNPGYGHSVQYTAPDWAINVYIYDMGRDKIPDDPQSDIVKEQLAAAKREVYEVRSSVEWKREFTIDGDSKKARFICGSFAFAEKDSGPMDSFVCLTGWKNKFVKLRLTTRPRNGSEAEAIRFVRAWTRVLWPPRAPQRSASP